MIGTITLNPSIDQNLIVENLVKDDANRATDIITNAGGKGINVSKVVRELGGQTHAYALLAGLTGKIHKELVKKLDFPMSAVEIRGSTRINTVITDLKDGTQTRVSAPGPAVSLKDTRAFLRLLCAAKRPSFWAFGGSLPKGMSDAIYCDFVGALQKTGVPCILDADGESLKIGLEAKPFMVKPNEYEIARLMGRSFKTLRDYQGAGRWLLKKGVKIAVISLAEKGALFMTENECFQVRVPKVQAKSKVGAGDSLIGGFTFGLAKGMKLREAARLGVAASVSAVMREAPRLCRKSDIPGLLKRISIQDL